MEATYDMQTELNSIQMWLHVECNSKTFVKKFKCNISVCSKAYISTLVLVRYNTQEEDNYQ